MAGERGRGSAASGARGCSLGSPSACVGVIGCKLLEGGRLRIGVLELSHSRDDVDSGIGNIHGRRIAGLVDNVQSVIGSQFHDEEVFQFTDTGLRNFVSQPILVSVGEAEVVSYDLAIGHQNVVNTALTLAANSQGAVGFALDEG